jgi:hypothetical protein
MEIGLFFAIPTETYALTTRRLLATRVAPRISRTFPVSEAPPSRTYPFSSSHLRHRGTVPGNSFAAYHRANGMLRMARSNTVFPLLSSSYKVPEYFQSFRISLTHIL